jgi:ParB family chromosome partitioning protein
LGGLADHTQGSERALPGAGADVEVEAAQIATLSEEYDALVSQWDAVEELPPEVEARFAEIDAALEAYGDGTAYDPDEIARGGVFVILGQDGVARIERGFIRPGDVPVVEPDPDSEASADDGAEVDLDSEVAEEPEEDAGAPLSERLVLDLTAQRTMALRDALATSPDVALSAVVHALVAATFYSTGGRVSCLEIKPSSAYLDSHAPGIAESRAGRSVDERHERWAVRLPKEPGDLWAFVQGLAATELLDLLAHCASLTVNAVRMTWDRRPAAMAQADRLAEAVDLDMGAYWAPTVERYLGRVTKTRIVEAVSEGVSAEAAERISSLKKPDMASEAEALLAGTDWLPALLRKPEPARSETSSVASVAQEAA